MRHNGTLQYHIDPEEVELDEYGEVVTLNEFGEVVGGESETETEGEPEEGTQETGTEEETTETETTTEGEVNEWSDPIPCSVQTVRMNDLVRTMDNIEKVASYIVLLESSVGFDYSERAKVRLTRNGKQLGDFEVISSELVPTQGRIKIVV